jgi:hypothetical protein
MAFTRFHDDPARIEKKLLESTNIGIYHLNVPGNGVENPYIDDVNIRLQKWGANLQTNSFLVNEALRDNVKHSRYREPYKAVYTQSRFYGTSDFGVDETRSSLPAWTFREKPQAQYAYLPLNPQANLLLGFENNCPTRMLEKDYYKSPYY